MALPSFGFAPIVPPGGATNIDITTVQPLTTDRANITKEPCNLVVFQNNRVIGGVLSKFTSNEEVYLYIPPPPKKNETLTCLCISYTGDITMYTVTSKGFSESVSLNNLYQ